MGTTQSIHLKTTASNQAKRTTKIEIGTTINIESETWLDYFPTEIILQIFDYLSTIDIINTFFNLNQRFHNILLENEHYFTYLEFPTTDFDRWKNLLPMIGSQVECLNLTTDNLSFPLRYFSNLKTILISIPCDILDRSIESSFFNNEQLENLHSLKIKDSNMFFELTYEKNFTDESYPIEIFIQSFPEKSTLMINGNNFQTNYNFHALTLTLKNFENIFRLIELTPNLKYLKFQSGIPNDSIYYDNQSTKINNKLEKLYIELDQSWMHFHIDLFIESLQRILSSSLTCLSLNLIYLHHIYSENIPFNSIKLQNLLGSITNLQRFYIYARLNQEIFNHDMILSRFQSSYWIDHNWSFGMNENYFYTLPFRYDEFPGYFKGFDDIKSNKPEILINNRRIWYNVKSIKFHPNLNYNKNFINQLKIKMPKLNFIEFADYSSWERFIKQYFFTDNFNETSDIQLTDVILNHLSNIEFIHGSYQQQQIKCSINVTPNLNHLILCDQELPSVESQLAEALNKKIQRLSINQSSQVMHLVETYWIYFPNIHYIDFDFNILKLNESLQWYADIISKILVNFKNLEILSLYYPQNAAVNCLRADFLFCLDMNEISKQYRMEESHRNTLFLKK